MGFAPRQSGLFLLTVLGGARRVPLTIYGTVQVRGTWPHAKLRSYSSFPGRPAGQSEIVTEGSPTTSASKTLRDRKERLRDFIDNDRLQAVISPVASFAHHSKTALENKAEQTYTRFINVLVPNINDMLNTATGYSVVQECKNRVNAKDAALNTARERSDVAKRAYESMIDERRKCQRELNSLLQRKDSWLDSDITRFTELYRKDLNMEQSEVQAKQEYKDSIESFERCHREYLNEIRERYIEEQLYSDKIRRASTWWTWGLISLHFALFVVVQLFVEPRKRRLLKEELSGLIAETSADEKLETEKRIREQFIPLMAKLDEMNVAHVAQTSAFGEMTIVPGGPAATNGNALGIHDRGESTPYIPKDKLFAKGVAVGGALGILSTIMFFLNAR